MQRFKVHDFWFWIFSITPFVAATSLSHHYSLLKKNDHRSGHLGNPETNPERSLMPDLFKGWRGGRSEKCFSGSVGILFFLPTPCNHWEKFSSGVYNVGWDDGSAVKGAPCSSGSCEFLEPTLGSSQVPLAPVLGESVASGCHGHTLIHTHTQIHAGTRTHRETHTHMHACICTHACTPFMYISYFMRWMTLFIAPSLSPETPPQ